MADLPSAHSEARAAISFAAASTPSEASRCSRSRRARACAVASARSSAPSCDPPAASVSSSCKRFRKQDSIFASCSSKVVRHARHRALAASSPAANSCNSSVSSWSACASARGNPPNVVVAISALFASTEASYSASKTSMRCCHSFKSAISLLPCTPADSKRWICSVSLCISARVRSRSSCFARRSPWRASCCPDAPWICCSICGKRPSASATVWRAERAASAMARRTKRCGSL
mmetsp:Transcript_33538/g.92622  ORF Transcript_33538/g.92622 Transcript_33538/m.92622 type:complete len:234 (-) Transcript_33538:2077-2778(-)